MRSSFRQQGGFRFSFGVCAKLAACVLWIAACSELLGQNDLVRYSFTMLAGESVVKFPASPVDGQGSAARFGLLMAITVDRAGNLFVADSTRIRKVTSNTVVTTLAGTNDIGYDDGIGSLARFFIYEPAGIVVDANDNLFVSDSANHTIRKLTPEGVVTTLAGFAGAHGTDDGAGNAARFFHPSALSLDNVGNVVVADTLNGSIRKVTPSGVVTTLASGFAVSRYRPSDGPYEGITGLAVDKEGNIYVADTVGYTIKKVTPAGTVITLAGLEGEQYSPVRDKSFDGTGSEARFSRPTAIALDGSGNLFVTDDFTIRKVTPSGVVTTVGGYPQRPGRTEGVGMEALFNYHPASLAADSAGNLYVADDFNIRIMKGTPIVVGPEPLIRSVDLVAPGAIQLNLRAYGATTNLLSVETTESLGNSAQWRPQTNAVATVDTYDRDLFHIGVRTTTNAQFYQVLRAP